MSISREIGHALHVRALAAELNDFNEPCIGCEGCDGLCQALIEAIVVPRMILKEPGA